MALPLNTLVTWLGTQGITASLYINWLPDTPDELVVVTGSGGTPTVVDGLFEGQHIHIRCRASTDAAAETLALQVHRVLSPVQLGGSVTMGTARVLSVQPLAPPSFLGRDAKTRVAYMATYLLTVTAG